MSKSCRICDSVLSRTHYVTLFSRESLASDLANRLSKVADVPVVSEDGLSRFICIPCKNKLMSGQYFRTTAKATYEKNKDPTLTASGSNSQVQVTNKRTKDSSGPGASPQTRQCRPGAKRLTPEHLEEGLLILIVTAVDRCTNETVLPPASLSVQGSVGSHTEENRPTLHEILPLLSAERFTGGLQASIRLRDGQRMRTKIVAIATRPSFFLNLN